MFVSDYQVCCSWCLPFQAILYSVIALGYKVKGILQHEVEQAVVAAQASVQYAVNLLPGVQHTWWPIRPDDSPEICADVLGDIFSFSQQWDSPNHL